MKKLFKAIRRKDFDLVKELIEKKPELVNCRAKQPPKKDDGQSPLQVAIKIGQIQLAHYLLDRGADINFMEDESCCNQWRQPVLFDAAGRAVYDSRWNSVDYVTKQVQVQRSKAEADASFGLLTRLVDMGAEMDARDSFGGSILSRVCFAARDFLPQLDRSTGEISQANRVLTPELEADLRRIFDLLISKGADIHFVHPSMSQPLDVFFKDEPVAAFLKE